MKSEKLLDAIGMVGEDLIAEAKQVEKRKIPWKAYISIAACLALIISVFSVTNPLKSSDPTVTDPSILQSNPDSEQLFPPYPSDKATEPPYNPGPIMHLSASPEGGYIGNEPYYPSAVNSFPNFLYANATAKAIEILPDLYCYYGSWGSTGFGLVKMELINDIMNWGIPNYFYIQIPADYVDELVQYDVIVLEHLDQMTTEKKVLYNKTVGAAEQIEHSIFRYNTIYGYNDGMLAYNPEEMHPSSCPDSLAEMEELLFKHCFWCDEDPRLKSFSDLLSNGCTPAIYYTLAFENGIFAPTSYKDCGSTKLSHNRVRRYINGIPTTEVVDLYADSETDFFIGEAFTDIDVENLPDVKPVMNALENAFQSGEIIPPHIVGYQNLTLRTHGIQCWYIKANGKLYAAFQVNFGYATKPNQIYTDWLYDDCYFIMETGSDTYRPINRDELLELQGKNDFIYTGEYNDQGIVPTYANC